MYKNIIFLERLLKLTPLAIKQILVYKKNIIISLHHNVNYFFFFNFLKKYLKFNQLSDITAIDFLKNNNRFTMVYNNLNLKQNFRLIIKIDLKNDKNLKQKNDIIYSIASINKIYKSSIWLEREVWDMYGIIFWNNLDLRRILTDYGFKGHPLRKDFPLVGFLEIIFDVSSKTLKYTKIELSQEFRKFKFMSAWKNIN